MPDPIDPKTLAFATESGLDPYRRYTEAETAETLGLSHGTIRRLRLLKNLWPAPSARGFVLGS